MKKKFILFAFVLLLIPSAHALTIGEIEFDFATIFEMIGEFIYQIGANDYAVFGITIIVLIILFRSIYASALARVKIFEGSGGVNVSRPGNMVAWSLSLLTVSSLVFFKRGRNVSGFLQRPYWKGRLLQVLPVPDQSMFPHLFR